MTVPPLVRVVTVGLATRRTVLLELAAAPLATVTLLSAAAATNNPVLTAVVVN
jgi:hypothetical protein